MFVTARVRRLDTNASISCVRQSSVVLRVDRFARRVVKYIHLRKAFLKTAPRKRVTLKSQDKLEVIKLIDKWTGYKCYLETIWDRRIYRQ